jgi:murein DD-endopeptidase MepM/ murein hydrolase activator NlpD
LKNGLNTAAEKLVVRALHALEHHPKHVTALIAALLLGGGGGAFAVASFGPDASALPVSEITEPVQPLPLAAQVDALDVHSFRLFRSEVTRANDTADTLLARLGINDAQAAAFLRTQPAFRTQVLGRGGRSVSAEATDLHALAKLVVRWVASDDGNFQRLVVEKDAQGQFTARIEVAPLTASTRLGGGTIRSSLFAAVDDSRLPDDVAVQMADIFSSDIDFNRGLRVGDRFSVVYESLEADGEPVRTGRVLSAEFVNNGRTHNAVWFQQPGKKGAYFTLDGKSLQGAYLASPMEFSRVTSGFANRFHPILKQWRAHLGVDYGAPTGTPVRTIGDGIVKFAGVQNGFGNVVMVDHGRNEMTVYAHLSRFDVRQGQSVAQGQRIGAVGATGWATGPHLHFEFRVNGVHQDPLVMARRHETQELAANLRPDFDKLARAMRLQLQASAPVTSAVASAR